MFAKLRFAHGMNTETPQRVKKASQSFAPRTARNKIKAFFRRRVRRKNTLRGASVESFATWGPRRSPAKRVRWGEEAQRSERRLPLCGGRRDTELVPTMRRAQRDPFGGKGASLFRQSQAPATWPAPSVFGFSLKPLQTETRCASSTGGRGNPGTGPGAPGEWRR